MLSCSGYAGKVVKIDLSGESITEYLWDDSDRERYLGGKTMAARILRDCLTGQESAFSVESPVVIATGPLTGTGAPGSARFDLAALSPRDDLPAFSNCGGDFGIWLKQAGYDALILTGKCAEKRWLEIHDEKILFHDAQELWGTGTVDCQKKLAAILGTEKFGRICIGPAGENLVKFASVIEDGHASGRAGIGAVLGYKNLKAITVFGRRNPPVYAPREAAFWNRLWQEDLHAKADETSTSACRGCPLRCAKHSQAGEHAVLNDLGLDGIAAEAALARAAEQGFSTQGLYADIAYRRGIGKQLAEGILCAGKKGGKRRGGSYGTIQKAFALSPDDRESNMFCRCLTEAISSAGQCIFTVKGLRREDGAAPVPPVLKMLTLVTGMEMDLNKFLQIGMRFLELEQQLHQICSKNDR